MKIQEIGRKKWVSSLKSHKLRWAMDKNKKWIGRKNLGHQSILELQLTLIETDLVHSEFEIAWNIHSRLNFVFLYRMVTTRLETSEKWWMTCCIETDRVENASLPIQNLSKLHHRRLQSSHRVELHLWTLPFNVIKRWPIRIHPRTAPWFIGDY